MLSQGKGVSKDLFKTLEPSIGIDHKRSLRTRFDIQKKKKKDLKKSNSFRDNNSSPLQML